MYPESIFRMVLRSRLLQTCLRNVSISRRHMCVISSIQLSNQITSTSSASNAPDNGLNNQEMTMRRFSSYLKPPTEFPSKMSNRDSSGISHNISDEYIFSPNRSYDDNRTIFVGGMTKFTTEKLFYEYFLRFGTITGCSLARDRLTGSSKEFGFVEFESVDQAKKASDFYPHIIDDQEVGVSLQSHKELRQKFKLFVGGLSKETSAETLRKYFSKFGQISECVIVRSRDNTSRGFGYVIYKSEDEINNVLNSSPHCIEDKAVVVRLAGSRQQTGQSRGFGYVAFSSQKELNSAINAEPHIIDDVKVKLDYRTSEFDVLVANLIPNITEKVLNDYFSRYGELRICEIKESLPGVRTGFVGFWSEEEVLQALADRPHIINGRMVDIFQKGQKFDLYIGNLPLDATDDSLSKTFCKYGKLVHWEVKRQIVHSDMDLFHLKKRNRGADGALSASYYDIFSRMMHSSGKEVGYTLEQLKKAYQFTSIIMALVLCNESPFYKQSIEGEDSTDESTDEKLERFWKRTKSVLDDTIKTVENIAPELLE